MYQHQTPTLLVKLLRDDSLLPGRGDEFAAGLDLFSSDCGDDGITIEPGCRALIKTGIAVALSPPEAMKSFYMRIASRSGLAVNGIDVSGGVVDLSYRGEVKVILVNNGKENFIVHTGKRIAQLIVEQICMPKVEMVTGELSGTARGAGGFGSTGV